MTYKIRIFKDSSLEIDNKLKTAHGKIKIIQANNEKIVLEIVSSALVKNIDKIIIEQID